MSWQSGWFIAVRQHRYWCILHMADCLWGSDGYRGGRQGVLQAYGMPIHLMGIDLTLFGFSVVSDSATPRTAARQSSLSFTISQSLLKFMSQLSQWCHPAISSSVIPFSSCSFNLSQDQGFFPMSWLFASSGQNIETSTLVPILLVNIQGWFSLGLTGLSPCCPRDSQESFPAPQSKGISSLALRLFYCPALISVYDYWKNHSFDTTDLCWQSNVSAFKYAV